MIELLVAASIIAILVTIGLVSYSSVNKRSRDAKRKSDLEQVRTALEMNRADNGVYPGTAGFGNLSSKLGSTLNAYIPALPDDPQASAKDYYYSQLSTTSYCICSDLETITTTDSDCPGGDINGSTCNYYRRNP